MAKQMEVTAKVPAKDNKPEMSGGCVVQYGETAVESISMFGDEAVNSNAFAAWRVTLQAGIRRSLIAGKTAEQIQAEFGNAKMGVAVMGAKVDPITASLAKFKTMTKEEQSAYIKALREAAQGA